MCLAGCIQAMSVALLMTRQGSVEGSACSVTICTSISQVLSWQWVVAYRQGWTVHEAKRGATKHFSCSTCMLGHQSQEKQLKFHGWSLRYMSATALCCHKNGTHWSRKAVTSICSLASIRMFSHETHYMTEGIDMNMVGQAYSLNDPWLI